MLCLLLTMILQGWPWAQLKNNFMKKHILITCLILLSAMSSFALPIISGTLGSCVGDSVTYLSVDSATSSGGTWSPAQNTERRGEAISISGTVSHSGCGNGSNRFARCGFVGGDASVQKIRNSDCGDNQNDSDDDEQFDQRESELCA